MDKHEDQHIEVTADGKQEIVPGVEPLKKKPTKKKMEKSIKDYWEALKKKLDNSSAFMPVMEDPQEDEEEQQQEEPSDEQEPQEQQEPQEGEQQQEELSPEDQQQLQQEVAADSGNPNENGQLSGEESSEESSDEQPNEEEHLSDEELTDMLKNMGMSDAEIAHIVKGHNIPQEDPKQAKAKNEAIAGQIEAQNMQAAHDNDQEMKRQGAMAELEHKRKLHEFQQKEAAERTGLNALDKEHKKRMLDLEYEKAKGEDDNTSGIEKEHKKRMLDLEYEQAKEGSGQGKVEQEHKRKMLQLEYETAKKEKELELEFREREHELQLQMMEETHKQQGKMKAEELKEKHKQKMVEVKKGPVKKPLNKSMDDSHEDLELSEDESLELSNEIESDDLEKARAVPGSAPIIEPASPTLATKKPSSTLKDVNVIPAGKPVNAGSTGWSHVGGGSLSHSLHGNIKTMRSNDGSYHVRHNGASVGRFKDVSAAGTGIRNYINTLGSKDTRMHSVDPTKVK